MADNSTPPSVQRDSVNARQQPGQPAFLQIREAIDNQAPMNQSPSTSPASRTSPRSNRAAAPVSVEEPRLSVIAEDGTYVPSSTASPPVPPRSTHRPFSRRWRDAPPRASSELEPPEYSSWDEARQKRDPLTQLRNRPAVARRGGWKRLVIIIIIAIVIIAIALGVGLGVGLARNRSTNDSSTSSGGSTSSSGDQNQGFPAGQYAIATYLDSVDTSCTANPSTFRCYPYTTYSSSATSSMAVFNWIITGSNQRYTISSSDNPFSITFNNLSLTLVDQGAPTERYTFSMPMNKIVIPQSPITSDNMQAQCNYNDTLLTASLYTKMKSTNKPSASTTSQSTWQPWPYAVSVNQTVSGGNNVPACFEVSNGQTGAQVTSGLSPQSPNTQCGCFWRDYNL